MVAVHQSERKQAAPATAAESVSQPSGACSDQRPASEPGRTPACAAGVSSRRRRRCPRMPSVLEAREVAYTLTNRPSRRPHRVVTGPTPATASKPRPTTLPRASASSGVPAAERLERVGARHARPGSRCPPAWPWCPRARPAARRRSHAARRRARPSSAPAAPRPRRRCRPGRSRPARYGPLGHARYRPRAVRGRNPPAPPPRLRAGRARAWPRMSAPSRR